MRGRAGTGPAEEPRGQPGPAAGQAGLCAPRAGRAGGSAGRGGSPSPASRWAPARSRTGPQGEKGAFASEGRRDAPSGDRGLGRARPGAHGAGEGQAWAAEVAQPPPLPWPSLKKGRGSRHFSSLKIKLSPPFLSLPFRLPGLPHSRPSRVGPVVTAAAASPSPSVAAAEPGAPAPEAGPLVWAGGGSSRQPGRATGRHSAMLAGTRLLPPREPACGPGSPARPRRWPPAAAPRAELVASSPASLGLAHWREPRAPPPPTHLLSGALLPSSSFLKGQRQVAGSARARRRACGRASRPLSPHVHECGRLRPALAGRGCVSGRRPLRIATSPPLPSPRTRAVSRGRGTVPDPHARRPRLCR